MSSARLNPFPAVEVDDVRILVDRKRPVAVLQSDDSSRFVTWPHAPIPPAAASARLVTAPGAVWVVYEEAADRFPDLPSCTAVRIGVDGAASGVTIGRLQVIGADSDGIWATPRTRPERETEPGGGEDHADATGSWDDDGAGLPLESWEEFHKREERWSEDDFAKHQENFMAGAAGRNTVEDDRVAKSFGWSAFPDLEGEKPAARFDSPRAPGPSLPVELTRYRIDGRTDTLKVDRTVAALEQKGSLTIVTFFPTNPVATLARNGDRVDYSHPKSRILVDFSSGLPSTLAVGEYDATALPVTDAWDEVRDDESLRQESDIPADDRIQLASVRGIDWAPAAIGPEDIQSAVKSLVEQLESLARPSTVRTLRDDQVHRVESAYRDLSVRVESAWPATTVTVEFRNLEHPGALYRRRYRVFDSSGRPIDSGYLTINLEEDIATGNHPAHRDGVVEFLDDRD